MFGEFYCKVCKRQWYSGNAWKGMGQQCIRCRSNILPCNLQPLRSKQPGSHNPDQKPHMQEFCEMCKMLGYKCCEAHSDTESDEDDAESVISIASTNVSEGSSRDDTPVQSEGSDAEFEDTAKHMKTLALSI